MHETMVAQSLLTTISAEAKIIGEVAQTRDMPVVELITKIGGKRIVQMPYGRELPRIC